MASAKKATSTKSGAGKSKMSKGAASKTKASRAIASTTKASADGAPVVLKPEFVEDLKQVFKKHHWSGHPIGFVANPSMASVGLEDCDPGPLTCPNGETPQTQWVHCPDGTTILRRFCP